MILFFLIINLIFLLSSSKIFNHKNFDSNTVNNVVFVDDDGNDSNYGTSFDDAFKTIRKAINQSYLLVVLSEDGEFEENKNLNISKNLEIIGSGIFFFFF
jgi:hypothetical protein